MTELLSWSIVLRSDLSDIVSDMPSAVLTISPELQHENLPPEVGLLLPTNMGPRQLIDTVIGKPGLGDGSILGLFLADPLFNFSREKIRLREGGFTWVANLPSVEQQDTDFSQQLADVGLDRKREFDLLARFKSEGFRIAAIVADNVAAAAAIEIRADIMIVMPRVVDFAAGFPSLRQRGKVAQDVFETIDITGWSGLLLGLGDRTEIEHESQWPICVHGLLCRPEPMPLVLP